MLPDGSYGTPYTIEEAQALARESGCLDPYTREMMQFLLKEIEARDNIICDLRQDSRGEQVKEILERRQWMLVLNWEEGRAGWYVDDFGCPSGPTWGTWADPWEAVLEGERIMRGIEGKMADAAKERTQEKMDAVSIGIFQEALRERLR